jgi:hypothetical protein
VCFVIQYRLTNKNHDNGFDARNMETILNRKKALRQEDLQRHCTMKKNSWSHRFPSGNTEKPDTSTLAGMRRRDAAGFDFPMRQALPTKSVAAHEAYAGLAWRFPMVIWATRQDESI